MGTGAYLEIWYLGDQIIRAYLEIWYLGDQIIRAIFPSVLTPDYATEWENSIYRAYVGETVQL